MKQVLHIASWYPNSKDPFDGDFIRRHAKAISLYLHVDVIHVVQKFHLLQDEEGHIEENYDGNLVSKVYFPAFPKFKNKVLQKILFTNKYHQTTKKALKDYIEQNGKPDLIHLHVPVKGGYGALYAKRKWNVPFLVTEHTSSYFSHTDNNYFSNSRYFQFITKQSIEQATVVSSVSQWLLSRLKELFTISNAKIIRNVVNTNLFYPVTRTSNLKRLIHVSMMLPLKNVEGIIDALLMVQLKRTDWEMVMVGDASDVLKQRARALGNKISWTGSISYEEVACQMQEADVLIHFSKYENLPCVINEALCCGLPVISSRVGGIDELINETNGYLVDSNNIPDLAKAILSFLDKPQYFNKTEISTKAKEQFSYEVVGKEIMNIYDEILNKY
jgi:glycosyltransferase involved in cell wall biosynthesis